VGTAGTYTKVITDAQGRVTSGSALASGDVTTALGFTPAAANSGYVNGGNSFAGNATIGLNDAYNLGFKTNNTTKMTLTSDGKLGIGTTTPNTALTVASGDITLDAGYSMMWGQSAYSFINGDSGPSSHINLGTSGAVVMTLNVDRNVGIGTTTPSSRLYVRGDDTNTTLAIESNPWNVTSGSFSNMSTYTFANGTANSTAQINAVLNDFQVSGGNKDELNAVHNQFGADGDVGSTINTARVALNSLDVISMGSVTDAIVTDSYLTKSNTGVTTNAYLFRGSMGSVSGTITNSYGLYIDTLAGTNKWGIYQKGAADKNYFAGNTGIGTDPAYTLDMGSRTDAVRLPQGTTAQRPANTKGLIRYNTSTDTVEYNNGAGWATVGSSLSYTPVNKAGDTMSGDLTAQNLNIAAGKFLGLGVGSTAGTVAGQMWYDSGVIKYFDGTSARSLGLAGSGLTSLNGLTTGTQSFVVGSAGNAPAMTSAGSAHTLNIPMASASGSVTAGLISNTDYAAFSSKMGSSLATGQMWVGNASGAAQAFNLSGDIASITGAGLVTVNKTTSGASDTILSLDGSGVANAYGFGVKGATSGAVTLQAAATTSSYSLKLPSTTPAANQVMQSDASGNLSWVTALTSSSGYVNGGNTFAGNATIGLNDNFSLGFKTNNATRMTIDNSGNVGIGTTTPVSKLNVHSTTNADNAISVSVSGSGNAQKAKYDLVTLSDGNALGSTSNNRGWSMIAYGNGYGSSDSNDLDISFWGGSTWTRGLHLSQNGRVGIGTSSPWDMLSVYKADGTAGASIVSDNVSTSSSRYPFLNVINYQGSGSGGNPAINLVNMRGNSSVSAPMPAGQSLGGYTFSGSNGTTGFYNTGAAIWASTTEAYSTTAGGTSMSFYTTSNGSVTSQSRMVIDQNGNVGINTAPSANAKLEVNGAIVSTAKSVATGATVNLASGNTTVLASLGGSTITLQNMVNGGNYTLVVQDTTSRTYTFSGCNTAKYSPANQATISGTHSVYNILTISNGGNFDCYITWATGFQ
jgi:hypothetical protein